MSTNLIDTDKYSTSLRSRMIDTERRAVMLTDFSGSDQAEDFSLPPNCGGYGRVHQFELEAFDDWLPNPLPIRPAARALRMVSPTTISAQVFQNAGCNWRCWYCFVPYADLTAKHGDLVPVSDVVDWTLEAHEGRHMVDLSGGQPDLTPEWAAWWVEELVARGEERCYVWSDDNLSTDYLWRYLSERQIRLLGEWPLYGRACCIKGYDAQSFSFNTRAAPGLFERQFNLLERLHHTTAIDFYVYLTITTPSLREVGKRMSELLDRLQAISEFLPLRCVPLKVLEWGPVAGRMSDATRTAMANQFAALAAWQEELDRRFPGIAIEIEDVPR